MTPLPLRRTSGKSHPLAAIRGARASAFPGFVEPCDPVLHETSPDGPGWLHEIKIDGYRAQLQINVGKIVIFSRNGRNWTREFASIAAAAEFLGDRELIIDGEATVLGNAGLPDFQALRREIGKKNSTRLIYQAFDLLYLDGYDLREA